MGVAGAGGGTAQLDFPQRFDTCPVSILALFVLYGIPAGAKYAQFIFYMFTVS